MLYSGYKMLTESDSMAGKELSECLTEWCESWGPMRENQLREESAQLNYGQSEI